MDEEMKRKACEVAAALNAPLWFDETNAIFLEKTDVHFYGSFSPVEAIIQRKFHRSFWYDVPKSVYNNLWGLSSFSFEEEESERILRFCKAVFLLSLDTKVILDVYPQFLPSKHEEIEWRLDFEKRKKDLLLKHGITSII